MLAPDGVAPLEDLPVVLPTIADLGAQLGLYLPQRLALDAAEPGGLVLYAEQERVLIFDG